MRSRHQALASRPLVQIQSTRNRPPRLFDESHLGPDAPSQLPASTKRSLPFPSRGEFATGSTFDSWPSSHAWSAAGPRVILTIYASPKAVRWGGRSAMSSPSRYAADIIAKCTAAASKPTGGESCGLTRPLQPARCGCEAIPCRPSLHKPASRSKGIEHGNAGPRHIGNITSDQRQTVHFCGCRQ